jgi:hypothetical protein
MPAELPVNHGNGAIVEVSHQHNRMLQVLAEQYCVAQHLFSLKRSLSNCET